MKLEKDVDRVPRALREVWAWKDSIYQDVKHLPPREALHAIIEMGKKAAIEMGFPPVEGAQPKPAGVAESRERYSADKP
ncbi:MAG: hypothetical protein HY343_12620 [Lentisphaerae bacterium]|nr:hypothetical protein [Lentisphaerota bacterium]